MSCCLFIWSVFVCVCCRYSDSRQAQDHTGLCSNVHTYLLPTACVQTTCVYTKPPSDAFLMLAVSPETAESSLFRFSSTVRFQKGKNGSFSQKWVNNPISQRFLYCNPWNSLCCLFRQQSELCSLYLPGFTWFWFIKQHHGQGPLLPFKRCCSLRCLLCQFVQDVLHFLSD